MSPNLLFFMFDMELLELFSREKLIIKAISILAEEKGSFEFGLAHLPFLLLKIFALLLELEPHIIKNFS